MLTTPRFASIAALTGPSALEAVLGAVAAIEREPMPASGFSGSSLERVRVSLRSGEVARLVLKRVRPSAAWTAFRTEDAVGREAAILAEPALAGIWDALACPYLAYAVEADEIGLLMRDLGAHLFPDVRAPLGDAEEQALLGALAAMHARFWESPALALPWLTQTARLIGMLAPGAAAETEARQGKHPFFEKTREGWGLASGRLPARVAARLSERPEQLAAGYADLPRTLVHGDCKVANFALLPDGRVAAFDWSVTAAAPVGVELGWYLAVNASRLAGTKEETILRYRALLEARRGTALPETFWKRTEDLAILTGALTLLWSKALALEAGAAWAQGEWDWWAGRLERVLA